VRLTWRQEATKYARPMRLILLGVIDGDSLSSDLRGEMFSRDLINWRTPSDDPSMDLVLTERGLKWLNEFDGVKS
jgi:hypothetical protein